MCIRDSTIFLFNPGGDIVDFVVYTGELANGNNKTLEKFNGSWHESLIEGGTPGAENSVSFFYENTGNSSDNSTANETGETGANSTNTTETNSTGINSTDEEKCVAMISITTAKDIFVEEAIKFRHIVNSSAEFSIVYWVEDLFGTVVKAEYETKTLTEKSFTPRPKETDRVYVIKSKLRGCEEASAEKMVVYRKRSETTLDAGNEEKDEEKETEAVAATAEQGQTKQKFSYELISYSEQVFQNSEAYAVVKIESDDKAHIINMSAYLYRGSKKYSEVAVYEFTLDKYSSEAVELKFFTNATAGDYKMKIKINKDRQKTDYEIAVNVTVVEAEEAALREDSESSELLSKAEPVQPQNSTKPAENEADGNAKKNTAEGQESYRSSKAKSEHLIPVLLISILAAVSAVLIWKR